MFRLKRSSLYWVIDALIIYYAITHDDLIAWAFRGLILLVVAQWVFKALWTLIKRSIWRKPAVPPPGQRNGKAEDKQPHTQQKRQPDTPVPEPDKTRYYLELLELTPGYTKKELERQFRLRIKEYHPDKLPPSVGKKLREYAEFMSKEINAAHDKLAQQLKASE